MFKRTNEETLPREYKKPSDLPLFANIDDREFEALEEKSPPPEFSSKLVEKSLIKNKVKANDSLCGLAPANFKPKEETPETEKDSSTPAQEAKSEDNVEENKEETPETEKDSSTPAQEAKSEDNVEENKEETPETEKDSSTPAQEAKSEDNVEENKEETPETENPKNKLFNDNIALNENTKEDENNSNNLTGKDDKLIEKSQNNES